MDKELETLFLNARPCAGRCRFCLPNATLTARHPALTPIFAGRYRPRKSRFDKAPAQTNVFVTRLNRLNEVRDANLALLEAYTYDATGNRLSQQIGTNPVTTYSYAAQNHRLSQVGATARSFGAAIRRAVCLVWKPIAPALMCATD